MPVLHTGRCPDDVSFYDSPNRLAPLLNKARSLGDDQKLTFANVIKSTVFMVNLADFAAMNEVYSKYFTADFPARSTIQVAGLPKGANVEIEVIAHY